jgi:hypothetical protein
MWFHVDLLAHDEIHPPMTIHHSWCAGELPVPYGSIQIWGEFFSKRTQKRMKKMQRKNRKDPMEVKAQLKQMVVCTMYFWSKR